MLFVVIAAMFGCGRTQDQATTTGPHPRIVCLSPAISQMLIDLGMKDHIVGGSVWDPVKPADAAVVGDLYQLDYEKLLTVQPDMILIQPEKNVIPQRLTNLADKYHWRLHVWQIETLDDVLKVLAEGSDSVGTVVGRQQAAERLAAKIRTQFLAIRHEAETLPKPGVLLLVGKSPMTAVGPNTALDQLLTEAGGVNVMADAKARYPVLDREDVLVRKPDVVIYIAGETVGPTGIVDPPAALAGLDIPAVTNHRVMQLTDPVALLPSTSAPRVAVKLAKLLHPSHAGAFEHILHGDE